MPASSTVTHESLCHSAALGPAQRPMRHSQCLASLHSFVLRFIVDLKPAGASSHSQRHEIMTLMVSVFGGRVKKAFEINLASINLLSYNMMLHILVAFICCVPFKGK